jgi:Mg-chelatase subunit ChlD
MKIPCSVVLLLAAGSIGAAHAQAPAPLDLVFVLDTTGSMSGEIREVKSRVRQIASALADARPGARVRLGLVVYRDRRDEYVTRTSPLSSDVEVTFEFLDRVVSAGGGGDGPEDVLAGLAAALDEMDWDPSPATDRQLFLIGDAPPHLDYPDGPRPEELIRAAIERRIVLNAVGCRSLPASGVRFFREIAFSTEGAYHHIGRVRTESSSVADAVLTTLERETDPADGEKIELYRIDSLSTSGIAAIAITGVEEREGICGFRVELPIGIQLAGAPEAKLVGQELDVQLLLELGQGEQTLYEMDRCLPPRTVLNVGVEVAK